MFRSQGDEFGDNRALITSIRALQPCASSRSTGRRRGGLGVDPKSAGGGAMGPWRAGRRVGACVGAP